MTTSVNHSKLNILNPKALERQCKILETHINELQTQINELEKMRSACLVLLGTVPAPMEEEGAVAVENPAPKKNKKASIEDLSPKITDLLKNKETAMTADEIFDSLKEVGVPIPGKRPVAVVYETLEKHPELFIQNENGQWESKSGVSVDAMN